MRHWFACSLSLCALAVLAMPGRAVAQDEIDRTPQSCIVVSRIDNTEVLDDRTILFYMRGRTAYLNEMPNTCPRLDREERFSYVVRTGRLCSSDLIRVVEIGFGAIGASCRLGEFVPMTRVEAEELEAAFEGERGGDGGVETEEIELPDEEPGQGGDTEDGE